MFSSNIVDLASADNYQIVTFKCDINSVNLHALNHALDSVTPCKELNVILDLSRVGIISGKGLNFLLERFFFESSDKQVYLCSNHCSFKPLFRFSGFDQLSISVRSVDEAIDLCKAPSVSKFFAPQTNWGVESNYASYLTQGLR